MPLAPLASLNRPTPSTVLGVLLLSVLIASGSAILGGAIAYGGEKLSHKINDWGSRRHSEDLYGPRIQYTGYPLALPQYDQSDIFTNYYLTKGSGGCDLLEKRSKHPDPDSQAEGRPHTVIERPGPKGQYTTFNGDDTFKQYRG